MTSEEFLAITTATLLGACLGSFFNVVLYRMPRRESLIWPGSHCPRCGHAIRPRHNLPILGWLLLGGRCHDCHKPISIRYPLIEAAWAVGCGAVAWGLWGWWTR